jgi:ABC-type antimicrobial peptide transport system permease subunit
MSNYHLPPQPPQWASKLLEWLCPDHLLEEVQGDLQELFEEQVADIGEKQARREYVLAVLGYSRPYAFKRNTNRQPSLLYTDMFNHFFKITLRHFWRQKGYSFLNIAGLSLGLATSLLILLWVHDQLSYDGFHQYKDRLHYVFHNVNQSTGIRTVSDTQGPLAKALKDELPEVEDAIRVSFDKHLLFKVGDIVFKEKGRAADPALFTMFTFPLVAGDRQTMLKDLSSMVISENLATKYFGGVEEAVGKVIQVENEHNFTVTGVFKDVPRNSSLQFDYVYPFEVESKYDEGLRDWGNSSIQTYVLLKKNASAEAADSKVREFLKKRNDEKVSSLMLQPFPELYLYDGFENGKQKGGGIVYVRLFTLIALFILLIACINFMNLATARSAGRGKEVGVRKVVGASRQTLIGQFIGESILLAVASALIALLIVGLLLPYFNELTGKQISLPLDNPTFFLALLGITLLTGIVAGSYPAFFLSAFNSIQVLKGVFNRGSQGAGLRKGLVVFQFVLSMCLIVATLVVYRQIDYIKNKDLGIQKANLIIYGATPGVLKHIDVYKEELKVQPGVASVASTNQHLMWGVNTTTSVDWQGKTPDENISFQIINTDYDFLQTAGVQIKEGRLFSRQFATDSLQYILNEEAAARIGLKSGEEGRITLGDKEGNIIGVVKNFHTSSLHGKIMPIIIRLRPKQTNLVYVRTKAGEAQQAVASLERMHKQYAPDYPFEFSFMDESFDKMYHGDILVSKLATYFACITIFISCLGLFGLASYTAEKRNKEVGIRKVLGASVPHIVTMLSKDFLKLVLIANIIAWPLAWWAMSSWLENFEYRTTMEWWVLALAGVAALLIALLTVSFQSIKAAIANPVKSLRSE